MTVNFHEMSAYFATAGAALERQPVLERERDDALKARDEAQRHAQALEERLHIEREGKENLARQLREVESARDTFRDEARNVASQRDRLVQAFETAVGMVQDEVRQIVPQPEPEPVPLDDGRGHTSQASESSRQQSLTTSPQGWPVAHTTNTEHGSEQAEPFPHYSDPSPTPHVDPAPSGRYAGKLYVNMIGFVNRWDWTQNGGTNETYDWREGQPLPEGVADRFAGTGENV